MFDCLRKTSQGRRRARHEDLEEKKTNLLYYNVPLSEFNSRRERTYYKQRNKDR